MDWQIKQYALLSDELWDVAAPHLPPEPSRPRGGRPRVSDRAALTGILFVLRHGIPWEMLPQEMGYGSGITCWRRLREWQARGVWNAVAAALRARLDGQAPIDWSRASLDSANDPARSRRAALTFEPLSAVKEGVLV